MGYEEINVYIVCIFCYEVDFLMLYLLFVVFFLGRLVVLIDIINFSVSVCVMLELVGFYVIVIV